MAMQHDNIIWMRNNKLNIGSSIKEVKLSIIISSSFTLSLIYAN